MNKCMKCNGLLMFCEDARYWEEGHRIAYYQCINCSNTIWLRPTYRRFCRYQQYIIRPTLEGAINWAEIILKALPTIQINFDERTNVFKERYARP